MESCSIEEICATFERSEESLDQLRRDLEDWLSLQPHLPQGASKKQLESFIIGTKFSLEKAKQKLDMYYTVRRLTPELFSNRDPRSQNLLNLHEQIQYVYLPKLTPERYTASLYRPKSGDASKLDAWQIVKYMFMTSEIQLIENPSLGHVYILDIALLNLGHLRLTTPMLVRKYQMTAQAYPLRIKAFYFINAPPIVDRLVFILKSAMSKKLGSRIHVFSPDKMDAFYQIVPKSMLPKDYGGDQPPMDKLAGIWCRKVDEWRNWFLEQNTLVDESLRPSSSVDPDNLFGFDGSFRKLDID